MVLPRNVQKAIDALLGRAEKADPALLRAVFDWTRRPVRDRPAIQPASFELGEFVAKVDERPWTVSDEDIRRLHQAGYSEDQIFELIVASAAGAGVRRFEAGLLALEAAGAGETEIPTAQP